MRVAVTGGHGLVGGAAARRLAEAGADVVPISRRAGVDVGDGAALAAALEGCEAVVHCAGINREIGRQSYRRVHVEGTRNVVDAARAAGVRRVALASFLRARPGCASAYHESKWEAEEIVRGSGLTYLIAKLGVTYGRGDHLVTHLAWTCRRLPLFLDVGLGRPARPVAVDDAAAVLAAAALGDERLANRTVAVLGPEEMAFADVVRRVGAAVGRTPLVVPAPVILHRAMARAFEAVSRVPLMSVAQARILDEGLVEPWGEVMPLPDDLVPRRRMTPERIAAALPPRRSAREEFGCRLLPASR